MTAAELHALADSLGWVCIGSAFYDEYVQKLTTETKE